jgi:hypothetical protein
MYLSALMALIFGTGISFMTLKLGTAIMGLLTAVYMYFLGKEIGNRYVGLFAFLLCGIGYWPNIISRIGLRFTLYSAFTAMALLYFFRGFRRKKWFDLILAGFFIGIGLQGYSPFRVVPGLIFIGVCLYFIHYWKTGHQKFASYGLIFTGFAAFILFLPLFRYIVDQPDWFLFRTLTRAGEFERPLPGPAWQIFLMNFWRAVIMPFWRNGTIWVHSVPSRPALDVVTAVLYLIGLVTGILRYIQTRDWRIPFLILAVPFLMLPSIFSLAFPDENPCLNRTSGALGPIFLIAALGMDTFLQNIKKMVRGVSGTWLSGLLASILILISISQNYNLVFKEYNRIYFEKSLNTSDIGRVIQDFVGMYGDPDSAYVVGYPYWVDTRLVGMNAGYPIKDYAIWPDAFPDTVTDPRAKMFILNTGIRNRLKRCESFIRTILKLFIKAVLRIRILSFLLFIRLKIQKKKREQRLPDMTTSIEPTQNVPVSEVRSHKKNHDLVWDILLLIILVIGAYFRFTGLNWDANQHLHPDERFLTMVASSIAPLENAGDYFNTEKSTLNPNNRGYGFYVYGTLPLFMVRGVADLVKQTGYDEIFLVGRALSGFFDLLTVYLVYLIVIRLYKKPQMALIAAALTAGSVMQIQLSHYFAVDTFTTFFVTGAAFFAVRILTRKDRAVIPDWIESDEDNEEQPGFWKLEGARLLKDWDGIADVILFGFFTGCAMASKINSGLIALMIPAAYFIRYFRLNKEQREAAQLLYIRNLVVAGFICVLTFRVFQPYAFTGPGFFGLAISEKWVQTMREISAQSTGDVDFPPALQWARRPIWFAPYNMILFGMGLPFGLAAFGGFLLMGWRIFTANWKKHVMLWGWTGLFFTWQATNWVRAMRYQVLVYPMFAIIAAWGIFAIWEKGKIVTRPRRSRLLKTLAVIAGLIAVAGTLVYGYAFTRIYNRTMTRIAASEWIYQNIPGAINLKIDTGDGIVNHPLAFRGNRTISSEDPMDIPFTATSNGAVAMVKVPHLIDPTYQPQQKLLLVKLLDAGGNLLTTGQLSSDFPAANDPRGGNYSFNLDIPANLEKGKSYRLQLSMTDSQFTLLETGPVIVALLDGLKTEQILLPEQVDGVSESRPYILPISPSATGKITEITLPRIVNNGKGGQHKLTVSLSSTPGGEEIIASKDVVINFSGTGDTQSAIVVLQTPVDVIKGHTYSLILTTKGDTDLAPLGNKIALETSWDDPLPLGLNGIIPFDYNYGAYRTDLNFEMYWDDTADKLVRFEQTIQQADYIVMTSNRQWGTTPRVPERYPLTSAYYRNLLAVRWKKTWWIATGWHNPECFKGNFGFDLVSVFQSDPSIGNFKINTQFAEEAFTVYDHPKVLIFKKTADYIPEKVAQILRAVDLSKVVHLTPHKAADYQGDLTLPADRLASQQAGGTWIELFNPESV